MNLMSSWHMCPFYHRNFKDDRWLRIRKQFFEIIILSEKLRVCACIWIDDDPFFQFLEPLKIILTIVSTTSCKQITKNISKFIFFSRRTSGSPLRSISRILFVNLYTLNLYLQYYSWVVIENFKHCKWGVIWIKDIMISGLNTRSSQMM